MDRDEQAARAPAGAGEGEALLEQSPRSAPGWRGGAAAAVAVLSLSLGAALWVLAAAAVSTPSRMGGADPSGRGGRTLDGSEVPPCLGRPSDKQQLRGELLGAVCSHLGGWKPKRLLVFGNGYDSSFWLDSNPRGTVRFVEDRKKWIDIQSEEVQDVSLLVNYTCSLQTAIEDAGDEDMLREFYEKQLPDDVRRNQWDVILVDGPSESSSVDPGPGQSIYAASLLAKPSAHVYVNNCYRQVELLYVHLWFEQTGWHKKLHGDNGDRGQACLLTKNDTELLAA